MKTVTEKYKNLDASLRLDAEYYVIAKEAIKNYNRLLSKTYKGFKTAYLQQYFIVRRNDIPEIFPVLTIFPSARGTVGYQIISKTSTNKRYNTTISPRTNEASINDLVHFFSHKEVQAYLGLKLKGSVIPYIEVSSLNTFRIPIPKISLATIDKTEYKGTFEPQVNEFKTFISIYYGQYQESLKNDRLVAATMLAGAISEAILYQFMLDSGVPESLLQNRGLGGLIRDIKLGRFNEQEGRKFPLEAFESLNKLRNDIVHPSRAIVKLKTDYELIEKTELEHLFGQIKRYFGL